MFRNTTSSVWKLNIVGNIFSGISRWTLRLIFFIGCVCNIIPRHAGCFDSGGKEKNELFSKPQSETVKKRKKKKSYDQEIIDANTPIMPGQYKCPCGADLPTLRGFRSHQSQSRQCRAWATRAKAAVSSSSSKDEALEGPSHSEPTSPPGEPMQMMA